MRHRKLDKDVTPHNKKKTTVKSPPCPTESRISRLHYAILFFGIVCSSLCYAVFTFKEYLPWIDLQSSIPTAHSTVIIIESHQNASLLKPYSVDYDEILRIREANMRKYDYPYSVRGIDRRSGLSLQEFRDVYDGKWPVLITDVVKNWPAANWTPEFFFQHYGSHRTAMKAVAGELSDAVTLALPLELFYKNTHQAYPNSWTYLQDELFIPRRPELYNMIGSTPYLEEDWFQLFPESVRPLNAMLLWGTAYSRSTLHIDPYNWTGTNVVLTGRKRWKMYPPGQDHLLHVIPGSLSGFPLNCYKYNSYVDALSSSVARLKDLQSASVVEFDQLPGELLIIPTGWFHQAYNVEETLAFSSQVTNRNNFRIVLEEVLKVSSNLDRSRLPQNIDSLPPEEQVAVVMSLLPESVLQRGRYVMEDAKSQIDNGEHLKLRQP